MMNSKCPLCGECRLTEAEIWGFECQACGEIFEYDCNGDLQIVRLDKWLDKLSTSRTNNYAERRKRR